MTLYENKSILPLEVWHGFTSYGYLHEVPEYNFFSALREFVLAIYNGQATTLFASDNETLKRAAGFDHLVIGGGNKDRFLKQAEQADWPFQISQNESEVPFFEGLTIDWGQTAIKAFSNTEKKIYPRNLEEFPYRSDDVAQHVQQKKIRQKLISILNDFDRPELLTLALPLKINFNLEAEPSTYQGLEGNLAELFKELDLPPTQFLNDAVLAALSVKTEAQKTLVITLGFGVGAALCKK